MVKEAGDQMNYFRSIISKEPRAYPVEVSIIDWDGDRDLEVINIMG